MVDTQSCSDRRKDTSVRFRDPGMAIEKCHHASDSSSTSQQKIRRKGVVFLECWTLNHDVHRILVTLVGRCTSTIAISSGTIMLPIFFCLRGFGSYAILGIISGASSQSGTVWGSSRHESPKGDEVALTVANQELYISSELQGQQAICC